MLKGPWSALASSLSPGRPGCPVLPGLGSVLPAWPAALPAPLAGRPGLSALRPAGPALGARDRRPADHGGPTPIPWAWPDPTSATRLWPDTATGASRLVPLGVWSRSRNQPQTRSWAGPWPGRKSVCPPPCPSPLVLLLVLPELPCWTGHPLPPRPQPSCPLGARQHTLFTEQCCGRPLRFRSEPRARQTPPGSPAGTHGPGLTPVLGL